MRMLLLTAALVAPIAAWAKADLLASDNVEATVLANASWNSYSVIPKRTDAALQTSGRIFSLDNGLIESPDVVANSDDNLWSQPSYDFGAGNGLATLNPMASGNGDSYGNSFDTAGVTAGPEPRTYALMFGGLAAVGFMARRRLPN